MPLKDQVKNYAQKLIETQPETDVLHKALRKANPRTIMFKDDGIVPNHPRWPLIIHRKAVTFPAKQDQAASSTDSLRPMAGAVHGATAFMILSIIINFRVVGAYPPTGTYDECTDSRDRPDAIKRIAKVKKPPKDPVSGAKAGVPLLWKTR